MYVLTSAKTGYVTQVNVPVEKLKDINDYTINFTKMEGLDPQPEMGMRLDLQLRKFVIIERSELIAARNQSLKDSDWRMTIDYPYDDQDAWTKYREELRDMDTVFPTQP